MPAKFKAIGVRPERPADAPFLRELCEGARHEEMDAGHRPADAEFQIVLIDGENAGRLVVSRTSNGLVIEDIVLLPVWRNAGIGGAVLRRVFGEGAATRQPVHASLGKGSRAWSFFERLGFVKIGETDSRLQIEWRAPAPVSKPKTLADSLRLPWQFESSLLQADLAGILAGEYVPHFNTAYFEGDWSAVPLRSVGGSVKAIYPDPTAKNQFADTPLLARCPYVRQVLAALSCPQQAVRFLRLRAGSIIKEHRDHELGFDDGEVRLHIPVITNPEVEFVLNQIRVTMNEGECWYLNVNLPHRVANRGPTDRIHLVIDCVVNDWLRALLLAAEAGPASTH
jgi:GNAT superfamily N-acetyltransferase